MKSLIAPTENKNLAETGRIFLAGMIAFTLLACQKEMPNPMNTNATAVAAASARFGSFLIADSRITLLQGNENLRATTFCWAAAGNTTYTVEAAPYGDNFADMIELATTDQAGMDISVKDLNRVACQLIPAGQTGLIELRVRANTGKSDHIYSNATALQLTTYQQYTEYALPHYMHIPGNFQDWNMTDAPHIVNTNNDGAYEGYINFTNAYPQFLMVKDVAWNPLHTYYYIGNNKFGFNGTMFSIFGGAGVYQLKANTNTNTWTYNKINAWGIHGTAVKGNFANDPEMVYDEATMAWTINTELTAGNFRIRANNNDAISFGKTMADGYIVPDYKGADFIITNPGTYKIVLNLKLAGNYTCTVVRNPAN